MTTFWIAFWVATWFGSSSWGLWFMYDYDYAADETRVPPWAIVVLTPILFAMGPALLMLQCVVLYKLYKEAESRPFRRHPALNYDRLLTDLESNGCPPPSSPKSPT